MGRKGVIPMSANGGETGPADLAKKINTAIWVVGDLFMAGRQPNLSPENRLQDAGQKLGRAAKLLAARKQHPELEGLFAELAAVCRRAEERMERFTDIRMRVRAKGAPGGGV
ncbi:MAG TPA: hypothetical protein VMT81_02360 [Candidatus Paceibacterota bacterium]|nr:hypothetical protein [Candidatus Paceibacterota bacterium]